jgi:hypothetical protein
MFINDDGAVKLRWLLAVLLLILVLGGIFGVG